MGQVIADMPSRSVLLTRADDEDDKQFHVDVLEDGPPLRVRAEGRVFEIARDDDGALRIGAERRTTAWAVSSSALSQETRRSGRNHLAPQ